MNGLLLLLITLTANSKGGICSSSIGEPNIGAHHIHLLKSCSHFGGELRPVTRFRSPAQDCIHIPKPVWP
jgi:hypothetical protein